MKFEFGVAHAWQDVGGVGIGTLHWLGFKWVQN